MDYSYHSYCITIGTLQFLLTDSTWYNNSFLHYTHMHKDLLHVWEPVILFVFVKHFFKGTAVHVDI